MATLDQITSEYILDESGRQGGQLTETNCPNTKGNEYFSSNGTHTLKPIKLFQDLPGFSSP